MGRPALAYLHQNRHGTFTFRWRTPPVVADHFVQRAFEFSLATKAREEAWRRALLATIRVIRRTQRKKLQRLRPFLTWTRDIAQHTAVSSAVLQLGRRTGDETHYEPFDDDDDLKRLFESDAYRSQSFDKASEFWIPMMGPYTGAPINELAQLLVNDITEVDGSAHPPRSTDLTVADRQNLSLRPLAE